MTQPDVPCLPLIARPAFAEKLVSVWRLQHLAQGEELSVLVWPGEWPPTHPQMVAGDVPVKQHKVAGGPGGMMVLGRIGDKWRVAYTVASDLAEVMAVRELALICVYGEI